MNRYTILGYNFRNDTVIDKIKTTVIANDISTAIRIAKHRHQREIYELEKIEEVSNNFSTIETEV